ncbi:terminase large subunit [Microbacterium phage Lahqtemish]|uniref:terminase large subunit n=1 Tax=Microbacterium phage Lahqtemish TaxID=2776867 RepID=UPI0018A37C70|nr:terminase large subunit [Microbacterium phage Lahqtemish]QOP66595.1 terminase large subunit [Microbacterium phage Lahqtemish]
MAQALLGNDVPRIYTPPLRELTPETTLGYAFAEFCDDRGTPLLPWQDWLGKHMLELLPDGSFRFRTIILLVARQNGKSTFAQLLALFFMYVIEVPLVLSTAQNLDIAEEVWQGGVDMVEDDNELLEKKSRVVQQRGSKALELTNGARWKVQAATRRGGRGLSGDLVMLDELREHQTWAAWSAISKTTMARENSIVFALSNAGDITSVVLRHLRMQAHKALGDPDGLWIDPATGEPIAEAEVTELDDDELPDDDSIGIFEWSARPDRSTRDRAGWQEANPSLGYTITEKAIRAALATDLEWEFRTEVLCQWSSSTLDTVFPAGTWDMGTDPDSHFAPGPVFYGVDISWDRNQTYIAAAGFRPDGKVHVEVVAARPGLDWVIPWLESTKRAHKPAGVVWQKAGAPVSSLTEALESAAAKPADSTFNRLHLIPWQGTELGRASGTLYDLIVGNADVPLDERETKLRHRPQPALDIAVRAASIKTAGDSWMWDRSKSPADIAPLVAVTGAAWALINKKPARRSIYDSDDVVLSSDDTDDLTVVIL